MNLLQQYYSAFKYFSGNRAFCINGKDYTYNQFFKFIAGSNLLLQQNEVGQGGVIGVVCYDSIETYAAIFAIWFSGNCFVPINPKHPLERNMQVIENTNIQFVFSGATNIETIFSVENSSVLDNSGLQSDKDLLLADVPDNHNLYILTTSGSTGLPKFVPISIGNVEAYCEGFFMLFPELKANDCFLQTYDLTSDAAFTGYLLPLLVGACVYTIPDNQFKFLGIAKLISNKQITWVKLTPSVLTYLNPYISKLDLNHIRHVVFGGEALNLELIQRWQPVFANAGISNLYGPTETTISATVYRFSEIGNAKSQNGIISIGKPFPRVECVIIDKLNNIIEGEAKGELCLGGGQTMAGYLNPDYNSFLTFKFKTVCKKYYRTGDIVKRDNEGFLFFYGRLDDQLKINGYRINILEVENAIASLTKGNKVAVVAHNIKGLARIVAFVESTEIELSALTELLYRKLPPQMIPKKIIAVSEFPLTSSGKIDKIKLRNDYICEK
jgi:amino acid adenylation domain-containing protein